AQRARPVLDVGLDRCRVAGRRQFARPVRRRGRPVRRRAPRVAPVRRWTRHGRVGHRRYRGLSVAGRRVRVPAGALAPDRWAARRADVVPGGAGGAARRRLDPPGAHRPADRRRRSGRARRPPGGAVFAARFRGGWFLGGTPECLVGVADGRVVAHSLAGWVARGATASADAAHTRSLLDSVKTRHEQGVVTEFVTGVLAELCTG